MKLTIPIVEYHPDRNSEERELIVRDNGNSNVGFQIGDLEYFCDRDELLRLLRSLESQESAAIRQIGMLLRRDTYW